MMKNIVEDEHVSGRRPLSTRQASWTRKCATWLSSMNITPNQISIASIGFALLAALCLLLLPISSNVSEYGSHDYSPNMMSWLLPIVAAFFIQCRLLCNLFDGMVAIEGGKSTASGELFNDIPDRVSDPLILIAAGYSTIFTWGHSLGWCAGLLAIMTAYVRTLSSSIGAPVNFQGPMAKQQRMALMTFACIISAFETFLWTAGYSMLMALCIIVIGCIITIYRRSRHAYFFLEHHNKNDK